MMALATASTYLGKGEGMAVGSIEAGVDKGQDVQEGTGIEAGYVTEGFTGISQRKQIRFL